MKFNLCDYGAYILVTGGITIIGHQATQVAFKNCAPFTKCITKIDETTIDHAENLDLVMAMYNLTAYNTNYSETAGRLWFYSEDEATICDADIANNNNFKSFEYKSKLLETTVADGANGILRNATIAVPFKNLSNSLR